MKLELENNEVTGYQKEFLVNEFKEKLDISDKYQIFSKLELGVLKPAKLNINKHSDIHIEYRVKKKG
jgi:plasmid replication initiation protein